MTRRFFYFIMCLFLLAPSLVLVSLFTGATPAAAAHKTSLPRPSHTHTAQQSAGHVTIIVLDMSGSMAQNDPNGYRCSAADAYIDLSGQNDQVGLVGLDNNNDFRTGSHNFETAESWLNPQSTATVQDRESIKSTLNSKSNSCKPDSNTPTYDSLNIAYNMLDTATKQTGLSGSVILLTDGTPCPDVDDQINAITNELLPKFAQRGWHIDTVGLGVDGPISGQCGGTLPGTFHGFLNNVAGKTGGQPYNDDQGPVSGVSPLNIGAFFVKIFASYSDETVTLNVSPKTLNGETFTDNFTAINGSTKLDVVAVKDNQGMQISLDNPEGQPITESTAGVTVSHESYQDIYSITTPEAGAWIVNASGQGQFMLYSLQKTDITVALDSVQVQANTSIAAPTAALPLGQPLQITAHLLNGGQPYSDPGYSITGEITPGGGSGQGECNSSSSLNFSLAASGGSYSGSVTVPPTSPSGAYTVLVCASTGTLQNVVASATLTVRLEVFPIPYLRSPQTQRLTDQPVPASVVQWFLPLQLFYSIPVLDFPGGIALQGHPAQPNVSLTGQVQWKGVAYPGATIKATAQEIPAGSCPASTTDMGTIPVTVTQDGQGNFTVQFPTSGTGLHHYQLVFETSGSFQQSQGNLGPQSRCIDATIEPQAASLFIYALVVTGIYLLLLLFLILLINFFVRPHPFGQYVINKDNVERTRSFNKATRRNFIQSFLWPNYLFSRQLSMPAGLRLRFRHGERIEVQPYGTQGGNWQLADGTRLLNRFQPARELIHLYPGRGAEDFDSQSRLTILTGAKGGPGGTRSRDRYDGGRNSSYDDFAGYQSRSTSQKKKQSRSADSSFSAYPSFDPPPTKKGKRGSKSRGREDFYSDDWGI